MNVIALAIAPLTPPSENPSKCKAPAGWRRGYAVDCKAQTLVSESNPLAENRCQDKSGTQSKPDNAASAGYSRDLGALFLRYDLANCDPDVALPIIYEYLDRSYTGGPGFWDPQRVVVEDARWWAQVAPPHERAAYGMAALELLTGGYLGLNIRKKLFLLPWEGFSAEEQLWFLQHIDAEGFRRWGAWALLHKSVLDSSRELSVISVPDEQTDTPELQAQELAVL